MEEKEENEEEKEAKVRKESFISQTKRGAKRVNFS